MHTDSTNVKSTPDEPDKGPAVSKKAAQSEATRGALVRAARELFGARGYADVGTEEIVRAACVTRGALYHHVEDKRELFLALLQRAEPEVIAAAASRMGANMDPVEALRAGCVG